MSRGADGVLTIRESGAGDASWILDVLRREWAGPLIERTDELIDASELPALIADFDGRRVGLATFLMASDHLEIVTLNSFVPRMKVGTKLIERVGEEATGRGLKELRVFTSNENLHALGFYQSCGFRMWHVHRDSITLARNLKPEIPVYGERGLLIADEVELRKRLDG